MKRGGGKQKGSAFERNVCRLLSNWVSNGKSIDVFWRSSISGGRATVARKKGSVVRQAGDICAVSPEGHDFCDRFFVECKHYKDLQIGKFLLEHKGILAKFWKHACEQANQHGREPMMICKARGPEFVIVRGDTLYWTPEPCIRSQRLRVFLLKNLLRVPYDHPGI